LWCIRIELMPLTSGQISALKQTEGFHSARQGHFQIG
jgi:hypothetical protein